MLLKPVFAAVVVSALSMMAMPTYAADEQPEAAPQTEAKEAPKQQSRRQARRARGRELDRCKREARGMRGPERGTFMTQCLGSERNEK